MSIKRYLGKDLILYKDKIFPSHISKVSSLRYVSTVGIGGNIGDVRRRFIHLLCTLKRFVGINVMRSSAVLKNPPFGFANQSDFYNAVLEIQTSMPPHQFLNFLLRLEKRFGRKRSFANAPRTLDLDIIFFDARVINTKKLCIPHPHWSKRESVLIPLSTLHVRGL